MRSRSEPFVPEMPQQPPLSPRRRSPELHSSDVSVGILRDKRQRRLAHSVITISAMFFSPWIQPFRSAFHRLAQSRITCAVPDRLCVKLNDLNIVANRYALIYRVHPREISSSQSRGEESGRHCRQCKPHSLIWGLHSRIGTAPSKGPRNRRRWRHRCASGVR
jgi:hypothetical protein